MNKLLLTPLATLLIGSLSIAQTATDSGDGAIYDMNPFVVESSGDIGYLATSTLAGTRINTELKDVGASVSVYTEEFIKDIDATSIEDILTYTTSGEGGGTRGNFGGFTGETSDEVRDNPSGVNRVRALAPATRTRDYFESTIPADNYNFGQVTVSRGPNAILAGTGSAGGVVDVSLKKAIFNDTNQVVYQFGEHGTHRGELHLNRVLVDDILAFRIDALANKEVFRQQPAYNEDNRLYAAMTWRVRQPKPNAFWGRTTVRANVEIGSIEGIPENLLPPPFSMDSWFEGTDPRTGEPWRFPKWTFPGVQNRAYDSNGFQVGGGTPVTPNNAVIQNFPLYRQWGLIFSDPASSAASVGLPGDLAAVQGYQAVIPTGNSGPGGWIRSSGDFNRFRVLEQGFFTTRLQNREIFDFYNHLITGGLDYREQSFDAVNVRLEQILMGGKAGFEVAYDKQHFSRYRDFPISGWDNFIAIDTNEFLSVRTDAYNTGGPLAQQLIPNPNYGRPFIVSRDVFRDQRNTNDFESFQANAFIRHDFTESDSSVLKWLGRHTLNGLFFRTSQFNKNRTFRSTWSPQSELNFADSLAAAPGIFATQVNGLFYLGDSQVGARTVDDVRLQAITAPRPSFNQDWTLRIFDAPSANRDDPNDFVGFTTGTATALRVYDDATRDEKEDIEAKAIFLNSHWLNDHVVTLVGWRRDNSDTFTSQNPERNLQTGELEFDRLVLFPASSQQKDSWSYSVVAKFPEDHLFDLPFDSELRVFWNSSENFDPVGQRRNVFNEEVGSPEAETEEYGLSLTMFRGKVDFRVTKFKTKVINSDVGGITNPYNYINGLINRMVGADSAGITPQDPTTDPNDTDGLEWSNGPNSFQTFGEVAQALYDALPQRLIDRVGPEYNFNPRFLTVNGQLNWEIDSITNLVSLSDVVSEGYEFELVYNPTRNWRIAVNVAKAEAVRANIAALELEFVEEFFRNVDANPELYNIVRNPGQNYEPWRQQYLAETVFGLRADAAQSGTATPEIRKWRANLVTRYEFSDGFLEGFRIGGAIRWQDKAAAGYPTIRDENDRPIADIANPYFAPDTTYVDMSLGYRRDIQFLGRDVTWNVNLNIRNIMGEDDLIPIKINPDGSYGTVRIPPERTWTITNSFSW